jgi:HK97 family phage major capsid protein
MQLFRKLPMNRRQERIRVLSALPAAYWVNGDTGIKQTSKESWADKLVIAEEIAVILPVPENVIDDQDFDLWSYLRPDAEEAIGKALDEAIFFGVNAPASFPTAIVPAAVAMSTAHTHTRGTATQAQGGIAEDFNQLAGIIEADGFDVDGVMANRTLRRYLRGARSTQGVQLAEFGPNGDVLMGFPVQYGARGSWPNSTTTDVQNALALMGDFTQGVLGVRQDITAKMLTEAVIQDPTTGAIVYNLAQQDMVALRLTARFGFQVSNQVTWEQSDSTKRYPWGVLLDAANP